MPGNHRILECRFFTFFLLPPAGGVVCWRGFNYRLSFVMRLAPLRGMTAVLFTALVQIPYCTNVQYEYVSRKKVSQAIVSGLNFCSEIVVSPTVIFAFTPLFSCFKQDH